MALVANSSPSTPEIIGLAARIAFFILVSLLFSHASPSRIHSLQSDNQTFFALIRFSGNFSALSVPNGSCREPTNAVSGMSGKDSTGSPPLENRTFISIRPSLFNYEYKVIQGKCTIVNHELISRHPHIKDAIEGADRCAVDKDVCSISYGISDSLSRYTYDLAVSNKEAASILKDFGMRYNGTYQSFGRTYQIYLPTTIVYNNRLYYLYLNTNDKNIWGADTEASWLSLPDNLTERFAPVKIENGSYTNRTLFIRTYSTNGPATDIHLSASLSAEDSGLTTSFKPNMIRIPERSNGTSVFFVNATKQARDGIYEVYLDGYADEPDNGMLSLACHRSGHRTCMSVQVGDSDWMISTSTQGSTVHFGGGRTPPNWLHVEMVTDKNNYSLGQDVGIDLYLVNNGNNTVVLGNNSEAVVSIQNMTDPIGNGKETTVYGIYAINYRPDNNNSAITLEPHSKLHIARTFVWNQKTSEYGTGPLRQVKAGSYQLKLQFDGIPGTILDADKVIRIGGK